jgi:hypothetical protein
LFIHALLIIFLLLHLLLRFSPCTSAAAKLASSYLLHVAAYSSCNYRRAGSITIIIIFHSPLLLHHACKHTHVRRVRCTR